MSRESAVFLRHILFCVDRIAAYTHEGREAFFDDPKTQDAVIRNLEIVGQAVRDLGMDQLAIDFPGVPWQKIAGLRNILAHQYLGVDTRLVWNVVERELVPLRNAVAKLLAGLPPGNDSP